MEKYVSLSGLATQPSLYDAPDGQFAHLINMIPEDGALRPVSVSADDYIELSDTSCELLYVHNGNGYRNLIIFCTNPDSQQVLHPKFYFIKTDPSTPRLYGNSESEVEITGIPSSFRANSVASIGNILVLSGDDTTYYLYWNGNSYVVVSDFGYSIETVTKTYSEWTTDNGFFGSQEAPYPVSLEDEPLSISNSKISDKESRALYNALIAYTNKKIDEANDSRHIIRGTFLAVVALRLYDGSYYAISDPIMLAPDKADTLDNIQVKVVESDNHYYITRSHAAILASRHQIKVQKTLSEEMRKIVSGATVFISKDIEVWDVDTVNDVEGNSGSEHVDFNRKSIQGIYESIEDLSFFKSIDITADELNTGKFFYLERITEAEEFLSLADFRRKKMSANGMYTYNNRLHVFGTADDYSGTLDITTLRTLPVYVQPGSSSDPLNGTEGSFLGEIVYGDTANAGYVSLFNAPAQAIITFNDGTAIYQEFTCQWPLPPIICFPDRNASKIEFFIDLHEVQGADTSYSATPYIYVEVELRQSLNFGMAYNLELDANNRKFRFISATQDADFGDTEYERVYTEFLLAHGDDYKPRNTNLLRYSEAENPFVFPVANYVPVGVSRITALATSTQPISEGQFGVAPLYVFTDEAVWALSVESDGTYAARQPASRDVCNNPSAITPIDHAVVFPTEQGLMLISGGQSVCISEALRGMGEGFTAEPSYTQAQAFLALAKKIVAVPGEEAGTWEEEEVDAFTYVDVERWTFEDFLLTAGIFYDYQNQRLVVFNKTADKDLAYVYSLRSKLWGTAKTDIKAVMQSYPIPFASFTMTLGDTTTKCIGYATASSSEAVEPNVFGCTRALKLDAPLSFKMIRAAILKGFMSKTIKTALFASNNNQDWTLVNSSTTTKLRGKYGNPWRFYRLAFIGSLEGYYYIDGIHIDYDVRWNNQIR